MAFAVAFGAAAAVGCDAIAGITDGELATGSGDGSPGDGAPGDATVADGTPDTAAEGSPPGDGQPGDAGDGAVRDGPEYSAPVETLVNATDGAAPPDPHVAPELAVLPAALDAGATADGGNSTLVATFIDYDDPGFPTPHANSWAVSTNAGVAFADEGTFPDPGATGYSDEGDPSIAADPVTGNVYIATTGGQSSNFNALSFLVSTDRGNTFAPAVNAADPSFPASDYVDVSSLAVDNASAQGQGRGDVYAAYIHISSTLDLHVSKYSGGVFTQATAVTRDAGDAVQIPSVTVAPNRYVHVVYYSQVAMQPSVSIATSRNQNQSYDPETRVATLHVPFVAGDYFGELGINGTGPDGGTTPVDMFASPQIAANPVTGILYVVYADSTQGADKANIYFTQSSDSGATWSAPVQVNDDTTTNDQFLPAIAVGPNGKRLAIDFYDRRDDPKNVLAYRYGVTADISGSTVTFGPNFRVSSVGFPILVPFANQGSKQFSLHVAMSADRRYFFDVYSDARDGNIEVRLARYGLLY